MIEDRKQFEDLARAEFEKINARLLTQSPNMTELVKEIPELEIVMRECYVTGFLNGGAVALGRAQKAILDKRR